ncbi:DUF2391 family protein [Oricola cellulosilytica]|nr:DUF2391 family protein [Oricola cellulosilytica]
MLVSRVHRFISPLNTRIPVDGDMLPLWKLELYSLNRAFCGALLVALPLLYTMEMWDRPRLLPGWLVVLWMIFGVFLCAAFFLFSGFRKENLKRSVVLDGVTSMGVGIFASAMTLLLIGRYQWGESLDIIARLVALESVPTGMGASVAISQLGGRGAVARSNPASRINPDLRALLATFLGALLFSFNIAPTVEHQVIAQSVGGWHVAGIALFSLITSWLLVFHTRTEGVSGDERVALTDTFSSTIFSYLSALIASYAMLWLFGYLTPGMPLHLQVVHTIILGYAATLGGAAGRILL